MVEKHVVKVQVETLHETKVKPPRRKLWDLFPDFLAVRYIRLTGHNPQPTPYERWVIDNVHLRAYYKAFHDTLILLNQQQLPDPESTTTDEADPTRWN